MIYSEIEAIVPYGLKAIVSTVNGARHRDYERVTELAELYHKVITGENIDTLLRQFNRREDDTMFKQRKAITQSITPAVCAPAMMPFYKVARVNNIIDKEDFDKADGVESKKEKLSKAKKFYYGEDSLDTYMAGRFVELSFSDPNAFIVTEFMDADRDSNGKPIGDFKPYPIEYSSAQCVNYEYENNTLKWLVVCTADKDLAFKNRYVIYLKEFSVSFTPIDEKLFANISDKTYKDVIFPDGIFPVYKSGNNCYVIKLHNHTAKKVPAKRVGYKRDLITQGRTFVSPIEAGMPYLLKSIQSNSEMDLTMKLHAFLQKFVYEQPCAAAGCMGGQLTEGGTCKECNGSGVWRPIHTTAQDSVSLAMPRKKDEMISLSELIYYPQLQVELLRFQDEYTNELAPKFYKSVFNSDVFDKTTITATATEKNISMESVYDTLHPFAIQYASTRTYQLNIIANYLDIFDLNADYSFPKDLRFRTRDQLLSESTSAANAPDYIKEAINTELAEVLFVDSPDELKRVRIKRGFMPFKDRTSAETVFIISNDHTTQYNAVLWANFATIFERAEQSAKEGEGKPYLYDMTTEKIKGFIDVEVNKMISELNPVESEPFGGGE